MDNRKNVLLVGCGAVGTIAALNLEIGGKASVVAVLRSKYTTIREKGFAIDSCDHGKIAKWRPSKIVKSISDASREAIMFDYIIITAKALPESMAAMTEQVKHAVTTGVTVIVLIQNGLNIERPWLQKYPQNIVLSGVSMISSHEPSSGIIVQTAPDILRIGAFRNSYVDITKKQDAAADFVRIYSAAGKACCILTPDVQRDRWWKLVYNATFNPTCAITGVDSGSLQQAGDAIDALVKPAMAEILAAAKAAGYAFEATLPQEMIDSDTIESHFEPSMLQDVKKRNLIEHEALLGEALKEGTRLGVAMPIISVLYQLCKIFQWRIREEQQARE